MSQGSERPSQPFWQMPPRWVWLIFLLAMGIFSASMLTLREGRRFVSRQLRPDELRIVLTALQLWERSPEGQQAVALRLRQMITNNQMLAMSPRSFDRAEERAAFGYTDERGRILLNPNLCFAHQRMCAPEKPDGADVVATLCTLYHESRHLLFQSPEATAYEDEWRFVRRTRAWARDTGQTQLALDLADWELEMPSRVQLYVGESMLGQIQARVSSVGAEVEVSQANPGLSAD